MATTATTPKRLFVHSGQVAPYVSPARFKVIVAGRRWGKTEFAALVLIKACREQAGIYRYVAPTYGVARKAIWRRKLKRAVDPTWLVKPPNETNLEMEFKNGSILEVMGADNPDGLRGEGLSGVVLDEYADMNGDTWDAAVRPSLADMKGWAIFIGTPKSFNHFYNLYARGQESDRRVWSSWQFKSVENPLLDPEEIEEARRTTDPRTFRQEWEASFETIGGRAYYAFHRAQDVRPVELERAVPVLISHDFNVNPSCAVLCQRVKDELRVWREVVIKHAGGEATKATAQAAQRLLAEANWLGDVRLYGDPSGRAQKTTGPSDHHMLSQVYGVAPGDGGGSWRIPNVAPHVRDRIAAVNGRCESMDGRRHLSVDPSCRELIADLEQVVLGDDGTEDQSDPMRTHCAAALGYLVVKEWPPRLVRQAMGSTNMAWIS